MEIYILLKMVKDLFGDEPDIFVPVSWTDNLQDAIKWREGSHMLERRDFKRIPKFPKVA